MADVVQFEDHAARLELDRKAFRMRLLGNPARDIAKKLKCSIADVYAAQHRMGSGVTPEFKARVVELDLERLEALHKTYFTKALKGDKEAAALVVRFMDRRAKYCGLDVLPRGDTVQDDDREPDDFEKIHAAIMRVARGPTIEGEVIVEEPEKNE